jgi:hypothetical protein
MFRDACRKRRCIVPIAMKDGAPFGLGGTRAGGFFVLTRQEAAGKWGAATYSLVRTSKA